MSTFRAPWSTSTKVLTGLFVAAGVCVVLGTNAVVAALFAAILLTTVLYSARRYSIDGADLVIHRPIGDRYVDLRQVRSAVHRPDVRKGSWRLFGIGGVFGSSGLFYNKTLGRYHAYMTDAARSVVLDLGDETVVVTPGDPARFVQAVERGRGKESRWE
jgi:hypothetical protein